MKTDKTNDSSDLVLDPTVFLGTSDPEMLTIMKKTVARFGWDDKQAVEEARIMIAFAQDWSYRVRAGEDYKLEDLIKAQGEMVLKEAMINCYANVTKNEVTAAKLWTALAVVDGIVGFLGDLASTLSTLKAAKN